MSEKIRVFSILDENNNKLFENCGVLSASIIRQSSYATHPIEDATTIIDHKIDAPNRISLSIAMTAEDYADSYKQLNTLKNNGESITIQSDVEIFYSMYVGTVAHEESASISNAVILSIDLTEQKIAKTVTQLLPKRKVSSTADSDTIARGEQNGEQVNEEKKQSLLSKFGKGLGIT